MCCVERSEPINIRALFVFVVVSTALRFRYPESSLGDIVSLLGSDKSTGILKRRQMMKRIGVQFRGVIFCRALFQAAGNVAFALPHFDWDEQRLVRGKGNYKTLQGPLQAVFET